MVFEPGPTQRSVMPMPPRIMTPRRFEALGAELVPMLQGADDALGLIVGGLAPLAVTDVNTAFNADVAPAVDALPALDGPSDAATVNEVLGGLEAGGVDMTGQQRDLPGPDETEPDDGAGGPFEPDPTPRTVTDPHDPTTQD